jgi:putative nucleotidyltransferase with HDIG domain
MVLAMVLSLGMSYLGSAFWGTRSGSGDLLFAELMPWGFVRRWRADRRLASAIELLGAMNQAQDRDAGGLSPEAQAKALEQLSAALEATDPHTHGHSRRVARHASMIARYLGLQPEQVDRIRTAAALHDVGKIETPASILRKPGALTDDEFDLIRRHPVDGARMVAVLGDEELTSIVRHHHERLDGTGYPGELSGDEIPLGARIISVADTFDAITSARPYRPARPHKAALDTLKDEAGAQLDPSAVRAFCAIYSGRRRFLALWASATSLPGQVFSWLGGGVAGVATAAQVAAVAVATSVGAATIAPASQPHPKVNLPTSAATHGQARSGLPSAPGRSSPTRPPRSGPASAIHRRSAPHGPSTLGGSPTSPTTASSSGASAAGSTPSGSSSQAPGSGEGTTPPAKAKEEPPAKAKGEPPAKGKEEPPAKAKGEPPAKGKGEPPAKGKEEPPAKAKEEPPAKSEPPGKGEPPAKSEPPGKVEIPGKAKGKP